MPLERGFLLYNRYRIEELIASGGMGAVYRATDEILGVQAAIKENFFTSVEFSRQFYREATILASLKHPNLPRVTNHFVIEGQGQYLAMDFIEGNDLRKLIELQGALPFEQVMVIGIAICDALYYLHNRVPPIVHRDIKPGNIKLTSNGQIFLVDFGLAKLAKGDATTTGAQGYTPGFAPPEQYSGRGTEPRSDIYALGATLYHALTGRVPQDAISRMMGTTELTPIRSTQPQVPVAAAQAIERAMAIRLEDRYPHALAFRQDLEISLPGMQKLSTESQPTHLAQAGIPSTTATNDHPSSPTVHAARAATVMQPRAATGHSAQTVVAPRDLPPVPSAPDISSPAKRARPTWLWAAAGGVIILAVIITGLLLSLVFNPLALAQPSAAETPTVSSTAAPTLAASVTPSTPPTETKVMNQPQPEASPTQTEAPSSTPEPTLTHTITPTATLAATPLGGEGRIFFASDRSGIPQIWSMAGNGEDLKPITNLVDGACQPDWSPVSQRLVFVSPCSDKKDTYPGSSLYLIQADGTGLTPLVTLPGGDFDPAWSPDGSQIAFTSMRDGKNQIYLYTLADHTATRLSRPVNTERRPAWSADGTSLAYESLRSGQPQVWTIDLTAPDPSATAKEFSKPEGGYAYMPAWSPDNSMIVYSQGSSPAKYILVARQVGNSLANAFKLSEKIVSVENVRFSPDGWWLVFSLTIDGNTDLYRMQRNGGELTRLTEDSNRDFHPVWKP